MHEIYVRGDWGLKWTEIKHNSNIIYASLRLHHSLLLFIKFVTFIELEISNLTPSICRNYFFLMVSLKFATSSAYFVPTFFLNRAG